MAERLENIDVNEAIQAELPAFKKLLALLKDKYRPPLVEPTSSINHVMYKSGQYSVLLHFSDLVERAEKTSTLGKTVIKP